MADQSSPVLAPTEVTISRSFDAPRELVYNAWLDPQHLKAWWGPHGFTNPHVEVDARPGGALVIHMQGPDGSIYPSLATFTELVPNERIVLHSTAFEDPNGGYLLEVRNTITFEDKDGKTLITMEAVVLKSAPEIAGAVGGMEQGWTESWEKLAVHITAYYRTTASMKI
ncbi:MAG: SRPBCC domain-containing protein [Chloroflexi bacterium]|nr:SRPBCC domain-containing protein [Chloroflexota bacterium]